MTMMLDLIFGKSHGVKVPHRKYSEKNKIEIAPLPSEVTIPMGQHLGAPAKIVVNKDDTVKTGQLVGEASGFISANIHSSVSGV
ncbi:MAG: hypothetical protein JSU91_08355, partial [Thermoplasmatales archaeon]